MDVMMNPMFLGEVAIAVAAKLSLLAAVVWVAKMAVASRAPQTKPQGAVTYERPTAPDVAPASAAYIHLRRPSERAVTTESRDRLRDQLLEYLDQRHAERQSR